MTKLLTALATLMLSLNLAVAEQKVVQNGYEVHYSAFNSGFLTPEVAQANGLIRSKVMAMVNIAVLKIEDSGAKTPVRALVSGSAKNLLQQVKPIDFKLIDEGNAIYYIGSFRFSDEELLKLEISVQPDPNRDPIQVSFSQTFYEDR